MTSEFTQWWHRVKGHRQGLSKVIATDYWGQGHFRLLRCSCGRTWSA